MIIIILNKNNSIYIKCNLVEEFYSNCHMYYKHSVTYRWIGMVERSQVVILRTVAPISKNTPKIIKRVQCIMCKEQDSQDCCPQICVCKSVRIVMLAL